jgi:dethiobiotin synthetase
MTKCIFITGTSTDVGKTYITEQLLNHLACQGYKTMAFKPIASGGFYDTHKGKLKNEDALILQKSATIKLAYDNVNPYCFESAIAPHLAAYQSNICVKLEHVVKHINHIRQNNPHDYCIIEGAGGWLVPLNEMNEYFSDIALACQSEVILVVGIKLGCINHALLTERALYNEGAYCTGWIANCLEPDSLIQKQNIDSLKQRLSLPYLGKANWQDHLQLANITL